MRKEKNDNIAIKLADIENVSTHSVKMNDTIAAQLKSKAILECKIEDISKHFKSPTEFDKYNVAINELIEKCIPDNLEDKCKFCKEESKEDSDRLCNKYRYQMSSTFFLAAKSFDIILEVNKKIIKDKDFINKLAIEFFNCFYGVKTTGTLYFNSKELSKMVLKAGFLSIAIEIEKNENLKSLELINESIDKIETFELTKGFTDKPQPLYPKKQKKFLKQKQEYLKNKVELENLTPKKTTASRPTSTDIAFFFHYTSTSKESKLKSKIPTQASYKEAEELYKKSWKNIQKKYNEIKYSSSRLMYKNRKIIEYVISEMLVDYPNAKLLAEQELREIIINS